MEGETKVNEEEEFEFRLRLEQEQGQDDTLRLGRLPPEIQEATTKDNLFNLQTQSGIMKGMTDPAAGAAQLLTRITPPSLRGVKPEDIDKGIERREKQYQERRSAEGEEGMDWARIGGNVVSPASIAAMQAKVPLTLGRRVAQGMATGGGLGLTQPVTDGKADYATTKALQAGMGITAGGAIPLAGAGLRGGGRYIDEFTKPFTKKGQIRDVTKFIQENIGSGKEKIIKALQDSKGLVLGNKPTSGQAITQATRAAKKSGAPDEFGGHIIRLEKDLMKAASSGDKLKTKMAQQALDRENALGVGDDALIAAAKTKVSAMSDKNYTQAWKTKISGDKELMDILENPYVADTLKKAAKISKAEGINPKENLTEFLQQIKFGLDKQLKKIGDDALDVGERRATGNAKKKLVEWMGKKNPAYDTARKEHAKAMIPIDRMKISKQLKGDLASSVDDETGAKFATSVRNAPKTIKKSTGTPIYDTLEQAQGAGQAKMTRKVVDEVKNQAKYNKAATGSEAILPKLSAEVEFQLPHILSRPIVVANTLLKKIGMDRSPEYKQILSDILENPAELERILKLPAGNPKVKMAMDIMNKLSTTSTAQSAGRGAQ